MAHNIQQKGLPVVKAAGGHSGAERAHAARTAAGPRGAGGRAYLRRVHDGGQHLRPAAPGRSLPAAAGEGAGGPAGRVPDVSPQRRTLPLQLPGVFPHPGLRGGAGAAVEPAGGNRLPFRPDKTGLDGEHQDGGAPHHRLPEHPLAVHRLPAGPSFLPAGADLADGHVSEGAGGRGDGPADMAGPCPCAAGADPAGHAAKGDGADAAAGPGQQHPRAVAVSNDQPGFCRLTRGDIASADADQRHQGPPADEPVPPGAGSLRGAFSGPGVFHGESAGGGIFPSAAAGNEHPGGAVAELCKLLQFVRILPFHGGHELP